MPTAALTPQLAATALAQWWEMAGLEPFDLDSAIRATQQLRLPAQTVDAPQALSALPSARAKPNAARKPIESLADAQRLAAACSSLDALHKAIAGFDGCGLKSHARNLVFRDGIAGAPIMIIGDAPDRFDDETGIPFSGQSGQFFDKMLACIGLSRATNCYLTALLPWRPPGDRKPTEEEIAICKPFLDRHIELAAPRAILMVGGLCAQTLLGVNDSVMKLRGRTFSLGQAGDTPALCILSPAYLLNRPSEKMLMWKDLLRFEAEISARGVAITL